MDQDQDAPANAEPEPDETNGDITMADINPLPAAEEPKQQVKLEDLFADVDSDDEFSSTGKTARSNALQTSSPGPASSPDPK